MAPLVRNPASWWPGSTGVVDFGQARHDCHPAVRCQHSALRN
jgi:hypothetical protein